MVSQRAKETQLPDAPRTPSEKKRANGVKQRQRVKALLDHTHNVIMNDFDDLTSINPDTLTDNELRVVMDNAKLIKSWLDAVESHILTSLIMVKRLMVITGRRSLNAHLARRTTSRYFVS